MRSRTVRRGQFQRAPNGTAGIVVLREQFHERVELDRLVRRFGAKAKDIRRLSRFPRFQTREQGPDATAGRRVHQHGLRGLRPRQCRTPGQRARIPGEDRIRSGIRHAAIDLSCKLGKTEPFPQPPEPPKDLTVRTLLTPPPVRKPPPVPDARHFLHYGVTVPGVTLAVSEAHHPYG
ncbi:hypothetical protein AB0J40_34730 [Amycolatopsis sp. NPDC049691]|uniref:hypothetical protein n=1 Tax=Amycolatopsis sp. NPDC049691 TaxID=3155155 RepID=UPI0034252B3A